MASSPRVRDVVDGRTLARRERYDVVYTSAIELFTAQGYADVAMEAIARRAGVARASVFNYFPRKTAILVEWSRRRRVAVGAVLAEQRPPRDPGLRTELRRYLDAWATVNERARAETVACGPASLRETDLLTDSGLGAELTEMLTRAASRGEVARRLDVTLAAHAMAASYFAVLSLWVVRPYRPGGLRRELRKLADLFLDGLIAPASHLS